MKSLLRLVLFLSVIPLFASAETKLYLSPSGNDSGSGDINSPLATLEGARSKVREQIANGLSAPVTVLIRGGEYAMTETVVFSPEDSGTEAFPITYQAYEGETPVFTGGKKITGWKPVATEPKGTNAAAKGKLVSWDMPADLKGKWQITSLYNDNRLMPRAESPAYKVPESHQQDIPNAQPKDLRGYAKENKIDLLNYQGPAGRVPEGFHLCQG
ncbi:MAG: hypothetical protein HC901_03035 [Bdellovibrionaceae bacterium]|nr:hypothetical protein [Pseudobdellovibrionaceae bacterium]